MVGKFFGLPYPVMGDAGGLFHRQSGIDQIKSDLLLLLLTAPGERVMLPDFGTDLRRLVFEPNDTILEQQAVDIIAAAIRAWEPRVVIEQIEVTANPGKESLNTFDDRTNEEHVLLISIKFFDPENIQAVEELRLEVPLPG